MAKTIINFIVIFSLISIITGCGGDPITPNTLQTPTPVVNEKSQSMLYAASSGVVFAGNPPFIGTKTIFSGREAVVIKQGEKGHTFRISMEELNSSVGTGWFEIEITLYSMNKGELGFAEVCGGGAENWYYQPIKDMPLNQYQPMTFKVKLNGLQEFRIYSNGSASFAISLVKFTLCSPPESGDPNKFPWTLYRDSFGVDKGKGSFATYDNLNCMYYSRTSLSGYMWYGQNATLKLPTGSYSIDFIVNDINNNSQANLGRVEVIDSNNYCKIMDIKANELTGGWQTITLDNITKTSNAFEIRVWGSGAGDLAVAKIVIRQKDSGSIQSNVNADGKWANQSGHEAMKIGSLKTFWIDVINTGNTTWYSSQIIMAPWDWEKRTDRGSGFEYNWSYGGLKMEQTSVPPGGTARFSGSFRANSAKMTNTSCCIERFRLKNRSNGQFFGQEDMFWCITIYDDPIEIRADGTEYYGEMGTKRDGVLEPYRIYKVRTDASTSYTVCLTRINGNTFLTTGRDQAISGTKNFISKYDREKEGPVVISFPSQGAGWWYIAVCGGGTDWGSKCSYSIRCFKGKGGNDFNYPLDPSNYMIVKPGGGFLDPAYPYAMPHPGEDWVYKYGDSMGKSIHSPFRGIVEYASFYKSAWGQVVKIIHWKDNKPYWTVLAHLQTMNVVQGQFVDTDSIIGTVGDANGKYVSHLHWEVRPEDFMIEYQYSNPNDVRQHYLEPSVFTDSN